jgi:hypothetical protein
MDARDTMRTRLLLVAVTLLAAGCGRHEPEQTTAQPTVAPTAAAPAWQGTPVQNDVATDGVQLTIDPDPFRACDFPAGKAVVRIGYDARPAGVKHTRIWFQQANGKQVLWGQSPGWMQTRSTGAWVHDGMKVLLEDVDTHKLLVARTLHAAACTPG